MKPDQVIADALREEVLQTIRERMGDINQRELAEMLDVSEARVSRMLNPDEPFLLSLGTLAAVAAALGCRVEVRLEPVSVTA